MAYATVAQIGAWFKLTFTNATNQQVTSDQVQRWIDAHSAVINARLASRYTTPITGDDALKIVGQICEYFVVADVDNVLKIGLGKVSDLDRKTDYRAIANARLGELERGEVVLPGSVVANGRVCFGASAYDTEAVMQKKVRQW